MDKLVIEHQIYCFALKAIPLVVVQFGPSPIIQFDHSIVVCKYALSTFVKFHFLVVVRPLIIKNIRLND